MAINAAMRSGHHLPEQPNGQNVLNVDEGRSTAGPAPVADTVFLAGGDIESQDGNGSNWPGERGSDGHNVSDYFNASGYIARPC